MTALTILPKRVVAHERTIRKPYLYLFALQVLDICTTVFILHRFSNAAEGNPVAKVIIDLGWVGFPLLAVLKFYAVWLFYSCQTRVRLAGTLYTLVIANNLLFLVLYFLGR